jgi:hypothetical protein
MKMIKSLNLAHDHDRGRILYLPLWYGEDINLGQGFIIFGLLDT